MAIAADAARMDFEWCFGTSVPLLRKIPTSRAQRLAQHEMILHPDALSKQDAAIKDVGPALCPREASAAPAASWCFTNRDGTVQLTSNRNPVIVHSDCDRIHKPETNQACEAGTV
jgi:hypothetical protein